MRDINLAAFNPQPHATYLAALIASTDGRACGLVVAGESLGRRPCHGQSGSQSEGETLRDAAGAPIAGARVQYFAVSKPGQTPVCEVSTDAAGRHTAYLEPGTYRYRVLVGGHLYTLPGDGKPGRGEWSEVTVARGRVVSWSDGDEGGEADAPEAFHEREMAHVNEELVGDWHGDDGGNFSYHDIEQSIALIARKIERAGSSLHQVVTANFPRPELLISLQGRGIWALDLGWKDAQWASAYRNFAALGEAGLGELSDHDRADYQVRQLAYFTRDAKRVESPVGISRYLADARVMAMTLAAKLAALEGEGELYAPLLGDAMLEAHYGGQMPKSAGESMDELRAMLKI